MMIEFKLLDSVHKVKINPKNVCYIYAVAGHTIIGFHSNIVRVVEDYKEVCLEIESFI